MNVGHSIVDGCKLTVLRNQKLLTLQENNNTFTLEASLPLYTITSDIGYVNLELLKSSDIPDMMEKVKNCKALIFDLRNYPIQFDSWELISYISLTKNYQYAMKTLPDLSHLGVFHCYELHTNCPDELWLKNCKYQGKIVVLINASTMSWAETRAMSFRINGATLVGTPTAGANGIVVRFSLPGGVSVGYSGMGFYYPNGEQMQRNGIIPDIEVYPTMDDILAGRDEVLEAAIRYVNSN